MALSTIALLALVPAAWYWRTHRTVFNPVSLLFLSFSSTIGFAYLVDYFAQTQPVHGGFRTNPDAVASLYGLGLVSFLVPWLPYPRRRGKSGQAMAALVSDIGGLKRWTYAWSLIVLAALIACAVALRSIPIVAMLLGRYTIAEHIENIKLLPVGLMAAVLLSTFVLILHIASMVVHRQLYRISLFDFAWFGLILLMASVWQGNRQCFLIIIFFVTARWSLATAARRRRSLGAVLGRAVAAAAIIVCFVTFFVAVGMVRHMATGARPPLELFSYFSWPVYNVMAIHDSGHFGGNVLPHYVLTEILPSRFGGKDQVVEMGQYLFEPTSPSGYFSYWFLDYGYRGVVLGSLVLSVVCRWAYCRRKKGETEMRIYMLALWCCATAGIYNHFLSLHYFWLPLAVLILERKIIGRHFYRRRLVAKPAAPNPAPVPS
jgi:hypothetical protein